MQETVHILEVHLLHSCSILSVSSAPPLRYEELLRVERTLHQELQALEQKFEAWAQMTDGPSALMHRSATPQCPLASARDITKDLPPEVATFEMSRCLNLKHHPLF